MQGTDAIEKAAALEKALSLHSAGRLHSLPPAVRCLIPHSWPGSSAPCWWGISLSSKSCRSTLGHTVPRKVRTPKCSAIVPSTQGQPWTSDWYLTFLCFTAHLHIGCQGWMAPGHDLHCILCCVAYKKTWTLVKFPYTVVPHYSPVNSFQNLWYMPKPMSTE